jgi:hypothetical protein
MTLLTTSSEDHCCDPTTSQAAPPVDTGNRRWPAMRRQLLFVAFWFVGLIAGFGALLTEKATPGAADAPPAVWPDDCPLAHEADTPTLILFAHPRCPCTRATLKELALILAQAQHWAPVQVVFFRPESAGDNWTDTDIVRQAQALTGVKVAWDDVGSLAAQFGIRTSGHVLLYDRKGRLQFSGGITALRGHEGENTGRNALIDYGRSRPIRVSRTPVYGCSLTGKCDPRPASASTTDPQCSLPAPSR